MKKTKLIAMTMVVAIMLMGAGYALWSDTLYLDQEVNTGYVDVHFVDLNKEEVTLVSDYMTKVISYSEEQNKEGEQNAWDVAKFTINNVYPKAKFNIQAKMKNNSTIPVKLDSVGIKWDDWSAMGLTWSYLEIVIVDADGNETKQELGHPWTFDKTEQIPVGGYVILRINFTAPENNLPENSTLTGYFRPTFVQYNK